MNKYTATLRFVEGVTLDKAEEDLYDLDGSLSQRNGRVFFHFDYESEFEIVLGQDLDGLRETVDELANRDYDVDRYEVEMIQ